MSDSPRRLSREAGDGRPAAPVRIAHLGLGNFFRAHQAWYTEHAPDAADWGIAAFCGRSATLAEQLAPQGGLYTLLVRADDGDRPEVISSVVAVHPADDLDSWLGYARSPELAVITLTVTEAGYRRGPGGDIDLADAQVAADRDAIVAGRLADVVTAPGKLPVAMIARRDAGLGPLTVLSCDNLPDNGHVAAQVTRSLATAVGGDLASLVDEHSFATSMVDRITPRTTDDEIEAVRRSTGLDDAAPVVTEPFVEWVVAGDFPAGRPAWDATFVPDVEPFEQRKLWLLNGSHTLMAYAASARGHEVVSEAIADPVVRSWVEQWWDEAARHLRVPASDVEAYRAALVERYENRQIRHLLAQIASDGSQKIPVRILPVLRAERAAGRDGRGAARAVAAWVRHLQGHGAPVNDAGAAAYAAAVNDTTTNDAVRGVLDQLDPQLAGDPQLVRLAAELVEELAAS
ncbi:mannitol dehydrogenase family protein [Arsenicicoccus piscis]|uniref:Mannitol-1-phosphate 5-dehydrogenase n=1 Tax=Arsenicicoccus piscis TaxID=673954 RepID=A0ABQ6HL11_9MICO|nr:mannitol dehydrogenase family protein [Arsenicicoccus piscis]MCH8627265.1 mannitol dehydrogenase family protein [Arsenicicoccus piscis]GMA18753.1 mannitol-1-phosphate 5-dehydrogenase [Arsenicicoccus piscis]